MAIRNTRLVIKNSVIPSQTLPSSGILQGEGLVNLGDGILFFSGGTSGSPTWVQSDNPTSGYFEVGSNLYQLKIRDKITSYSGVTDLTGKILSGTSQGFVLVDAANINGVSAFTYNELTNTLTIIDTSGDQYPATITSFSGLTINGNLDVTGTETVNDLTITGTGLYNTTATGTNPNEIVNYSSLTGFSLINDVYVTGNTLTPATDFTNTQQALLEYHGTPIGGPYVIDTLDTFTTGGTYDNNTALITFDKNDGSNYTVDLSSLDLNDTFVTGGTVSYVGPDGTLTLTRNDNVDITITGITDVAVTGFSYNPSTNTFTITDNDSGSYPAQFTSVSGLSFSNLTQGRVVYVGTGGLLTDEAGFTYDENTNTLGVENIDAFGDVTIQGSLTVFGSSVSAFTSNLYVEDPNITLNYNPTGSTTVTSVNAGLTIQDGNGVSSGDVNFDIVRMQNLTGLTSNEVPSVSEYTGLTGYDNRGFITQLNDIIIRSTDVTDGGSAGDINGVRVLAEFDVLDGGTY